MSTALSVITGIGVIGSIIFAGLQARFLAKQVGQQLAMNGVTTLYAGLNPFLGLYGHLLDDPSLIPHFFPERSDRPLDEADPAKVKVFAGMLADILNILLHTLSEIGTAQSESSMEPYCRKLLTESRALREEVLSKPWAYAHLWRVLRSTDVPEDAPRAGHGDAGIAEAEAA